LELLGFFFPNFYDIKYLNLFSGNFVGGLNKLSQKLQIDRIGQVHQAGSDSILTFSVFEKLKHLNFDGVIAKKFQGILFGINDTQSKKYVCEKNLK
jgi:CCR4-NOT transcription complex subunit 7/8